MCDITAQESRTLPRNVRRISLGPRKFHCDLFHSTRTREAVNLQLSLTPGNKEEPSVSDSSLLGTRGRCFLPKMPPLEMVVLPFLCIHPPTAGNVIAGLRATASTGNCSLPQGTTTATDRGGQESKAWAAPWPPFGTTLKSRPSSRAPVRCLHQ